MPETPERNQDRLGPAEDEILEKNISRLLQAADRPPQPSEASLAQWRRALHEQLPETTTVARAQVASRPSVLFGPLAAAAFLILGIGWVLLGPGGGVPNDGVLAAVARGDAERRSGADGEWRSFTGRTPWEIGEEFRGSVAVVRTIEGANELDEGSSLVERLTVKDGWVRRDRNRIHLADGAGEWWLAEGHTGSLETPLLTLSATDAEIEILIEGATTPTPPTGERGPEMNKWIGATVGVAAIVTVIVLATGEDAVEIDHSGGRESLETGDRMTVTSDGAATVTRARDRGDLASNDRGESEQEAAARSFEEAPTVDLREVYLSVIDGEGEPVEGARIALVAGATPPAENSAPPIAGEEVAIVYRGVTDEEGRTSIRVPADELTWSAAVEAKRYGRAEGTLGEEGAEAAEPMGEPATGAESNAMALPGAQEEFPWQLVLPYETSIAGVVIDAATGEPLQGNLVSLQRDVGPTGWSEPKLETFPDEDGSFYFGGIRPGTYWVWAYHEGYMRSDKWTVTVEEGQRLEGAPIALFPGVEVQVQLFDKQTGAPVSGGVVYAPVDHLPGSVDFPHRGRVFDERVRDVGRSDSKGVVELADLPARKTLLRTLHPDYRNTDIEVEGRSGERLEVEIALEKGPRIHGDVIDEDGNPVNTGEVVAVKMTMQRDRADILMGAIRDGVYEIPHVNPGQYVVIYSTTTDGSDMDMKFAQVQTTKDTVVDFVKIAELATLRGTMFDADRKPLVRSYVTVTSIDENGEVTFRSGTTDDEGRFEIRNLPLQEWSVAVSRSPESMVLVGSEDLSEAIDYEGEYFLPRGEIAGVVRTADGELAEQVELFVMRVRDDGGMDWLGRSEVMRDGEFSFVGLEQGIYRVFAQGPGFRQTMSEDVKVVESAATVEITVEMGGGVKVSVIEADGTPAADLAVRIFAEQGFPVNDGLPSRTDDNGAYTFDSLGPGSYRITLSREGELLPVEKNFDAEMGETVEVQIRLQ